MTGRVVLLCIVCMTLGVLSCGGPVVDVPSPDLSGAEPEVVRAVEQARDAVRDNPESLKAWSALGDRLKAHGWDAEAVRCYEKAERLDPNGFRWPYLIGLIRFQRDFEAAAAAFGRALAIDDGYAKAHLYLAQSLVKLGRPEEAREHYLTAARLDPSDPGPPLGLGQMDLAAGRPQEALEHLLHSLELDASTREVHIALAQAYFALGDKDSAAGHAELGRTLPERTAGPDPRATVSVSPAGSEAYLALGVKALADGKPAEAETHLRAALRNNPDLATAHHSLGVALARQGKLAEAELQLKESLRLKPQNAPAHAYLAGVLGRLQRIDEAIGEYREALSLDPDDMTSRFNLGTLLARQGKTGEAIPYLDTVVTANPQDAAARLNLGMALLIENRPAEAEPHLREAARLDPANPLAKQWLDDCLTRLHRAVR